MKKKKLKKALLATGAVTALTVAPFQALAADNTHINDVAADFKLAVGESTTLTAVAEFLEKETGSKNYKIEWSVNEEDKQIASVDSRGKVTGKAAGKAEITATIRGEKNLRATAVVEVFSTVDSLAVKNKVLNLKVGESLPIEYQVLPTSATNKNVKLKSTDTKIAKVDSKGNIIGVKEGSTEILISTVDAGKDPFNNPIQEKITVNVASTVKGVEITNTPSKKIRLKANETFQLEWKVLPGTASLKDVTFKSTNSKAASVSSKGLIKGLATGGETTVQVITKDGQHIDEVVVDVEGSTTTPVVSEIAIDNKVTNGRKTIDLTVGESTTLKVNAKPTDFKLRTSDLIFEVNDPTVVKVLSSGKITALKAGETKVTVKYAKDESVYDEIYVKSISTVTGITGEKTWTLRVGEVAAPPVKIQPSNSKNQEMKITHDGRGVIKVASNNQTIEGLKAGSVNAVFTTVDGGYEHSMTINVVSTVTSFEIPFSKVEIGLDPYTIEPKFNNGALLKDVKYEITGDKKVISINSKTNTITPKTEGTTTVRAISVDGEIEDEFTVVVKFDAEKINIYDENNKLISSSNPYEKGKDKDSEKDNNKGNDKDNSEQENSNKLIRKMILEKLLEKTKNPIAKEIIRKLIIRI